MWLPFESPLLAHVEKKPHPENELCALGTNTLSKIVHIRNYACTVKRIIWISSTLEVTISVINKLTN